MNRVRSFVRACGANGDTLSPDSFSDDVTVGRRYAADSGASVTARDRIRMKLATGEGDTSPSAIASAVRAECPGIGVSGVMHEIRRIRGDIHGAGPIEPLLDIPGVTDVLVNGHAEVWVDGASGLRRVDSPFRDDEQVRATAVRVAAACGRRLDDASPYADGFYHRGVPSAHLGRRTSTSAHIPSTTAITRTSSASGDSYGSTTPPTGARVRVHAVLPPVVDRPCMSLRLLGTASARLDALVEGGSVPHEMADELRALVRSRQAFLVSGGTGAGKTTLLSALLSEVSPGERIVCVEDTPELQPEHPHIVALTTSPANVEGRGEITLRDVVRQTLRMRPDRIVVGEIRGGEIGELFAALNTGHDGGCGTIHANGPEEIPARCEALGAMAGMSPESVRMQLHAAIRVVLHVERCASGPPGGMEPHAVKPHGVRRRLGRVGVVPPAWMDSADHGGSAATAPPSTPTVVPVWTAEGGRTDAWPLWEHMVHGGAR
ncbi:TadA family conjugal transfer-associated ATPase [Corynebacterium kroppenstedtii]|uniref:TadA family conjugal transfer-associated ATPase n=1 Tax=Corynebacterium sp. PCR 32 TaxID=3351342 RepID=UPI00309F770B